MMEVIEASELPGQQVAPDASTAPGRMDYALQTGLLTCFRWHRNQPVRDGRAIRGHRQTGVQIHIPYIAYPAAHVVRTKQWRSTEVDLDVV
jgi:hypothetical protein